MNRHELHAEREKQLEKKLRAVAYAASTAKQFFDAMPEAREILSEVVADSAPRTDVAVITADVWRDLEAARKQEAEA